VAFEPDVLGSGLEDEADPDDLVAERRAEEKIDSWIALCRDRQAPNEAQRKTATTPNPKDKIDPNEVRIPLQPPGSPDECRMENNQVRITLTTRRDAQGRITGTRSS
jgi:hypothetical protein